MSAFGRLPLANFLGTKNNLQGKIDRAIAGRTSECMADRGFRFEPLQETFTETPALVLRRYGIVDRRTAATAGYRESIQ